MRRAMLTARPNVAVPAFVAVGAVAANVGLNITPAKPAGVVTGDKILLGLFTNTSSETFTAPAGFALVVTATGAAGKASLYLRTVDGSEGSTFTATIASGSDVIARCVAWANISATAGATATATPSGAGTTLAYPAVSSASGDLVVGFGFGFAGSAMSFSTPTGYTERADNDTDIFGSHFGSQVIDLLATGSTGSQNSTVAPSSTRIALAAAFPPA